MSLAGADPFLVLTGREGRWIVFEGEHRREERGDPFELLRSIIASLRGAEVIAVGYLGYDLGGYMERLPRRAVDDQGFPDIHFAFYDRWVEADHARGEFRARGERHRWPPVSTDLDAFFPGPSGPPEANFTRGAYLRAVGRVRELIAAGEIYQVNLSQRFSASWSPSPYPLYQRLRQASPAPYSALLGLGHRAVISSSPEEFLSLDGSHVRTTPIKGTRPRGLTSRQDEALERELIASAKDIAELTMIVDLERNDLGRVCIPGTIRVSEPTRIEAHPTVWHLSSTIEGELEPGRDVVDLLRATFPGGSVTGAPKIRAMEIIDELEPTRRGVFTGAMGYLMPGSEAGSDRLVMSIAIRTMQIHRGWVTFQAGGAVVWDSVPEQEYEETLVKARAMGRALTRMTQEPPGRG